MNDESDALDESPKFEYDEGFQDKISGLFCRDNGFAKRVLDLIDPSYFTNAGTSELIRICKTHIGKYGHTPDKTTLIKILKDIADTKAMRIDLFDDVKKAVFRALQSDISNAKYVEDEVAKFAKHQAIQNAMMKAIPLLDKGDFSQIQQLMQTACRVGVSEEWEDYDYWERIRDRSARRDDIANGVLIGAGITTGYPKVDCHLYHNGWGRKELSVLMGGAKAGKSMGLGDFAKNASLAGFNVIYVSLEVSKEIISERIDANLTDTLMISLVSDRATVEAKIKAAETKSGEFKVIDYPSGTLKVSMLNRMLESYRDRGIIFDLIVVDYADIMARERNSDDLREGLRNIYIDLRALAYVWDAAVLTATQTNRAGAAAVTAKATDVGDDWNKIRTADVVIGINATDAERQAGEARLYWAVSRNTADGFSLRISQDRGRMKFLKDVIGIEF